MHISSRKFGFLGGFLFVLLMLAMPAMAQNRIFQGKVTDEKGQPVVGAKILIQAMDGQRKYDTKTNKKGEWIYMGIAAGDYRVVVRAEGFAPDYRQPLRASIQDPAVADFKLNPGDPNQKLGFELSAQEIEQIKAEQKKLAERKQSSTEVQTLFTAGIDLAAQGKHEEAIAEFQKALALDPEQSNIIGNMAESYSKLGKDNEALAAYEKAIAVNPNDAALYTNMGVVLSRLGKNAESQEAFKKAATLNPGASAQSFYNIGATLVNNGKTQEAAEQFKAAISADPNFAEAYYQLGMCLSGKPETMPDAIKALQKYIEIGKKPDEVETAKAIIQALQQAMKK
jgi:tetratricopeptide (TPR) repeat protein